MLKGWAREAFNPKDDKKPISPQVLHGLLKVLDRICFSVYETKLFYSIALVAFFGPLHINELVMCLHSEPHPRAFSFQDISVSESGLMLSVKRSKMDLRGKGVVFSLGVCEQEDLCPVKAIWEYMAMRGTIPGPWFCHSENAPLTKHQFWVITSWPLLEVGLQGTCFSTHSYRIGAASTAAAMGYPPTLSNQTGKALVLKGLQGLCSAS